MDEIIQAGIKVNEMIKNSQEYRWYLRASRALNENVDLYNQLKEYRRRNCELQNQANTNPYDEIIALVREYDELLHNSIVSDFLKAEESICRIMRQVYTQIGEGLEFDYLDE